MSAGHDWPFREAGRILERLQRYPDKNKGFVLLETGYGPSGLPHIGTFGEVVRMSFVRHALTQLAPDISIRLRVFSDDMDALRRIPDNVPQREMLQLHLGKPLCNIPDPHGTHDSYGGHMNARLCRFLDDFGFEYEFFSAASCYKSGMFDPWLFKAAERYDGLMDIMLPTLGNQRSATYSPFMPIDPVSGIVLNEGVIKVDHDSGLIYYKDSLGKEKNMPFTQGNCKLQWKCDFGMRWAAFDVDYEMYGKDHYPNEPIYRQICSLLSDKEPPVNYFYELFLDEHGKRISKSKGNGISIEKWLHYATTESLAYYMFQKPRTAKRLYFDVIPKAMDEYLHLLNQYHKQDTEARRNNPVYFIHTDKNPSSQIDISFNLLINLASACNPENENMLWGFISKHDPSLVPGQNALLDKMVISATHYYQDFILSNKQYRAPSEAERRALQQFSEDLGAILPEASDLALNIQNLAYEIAASNALSNKEWFTAIYEVLLGTNNGPRIGSFVALYGIENMIKLIKSKLEK